MRLPFTQWMILRVAVAGAWALGVCLTGCQPDDSKDPGTQPMSENHGGASTGGSAGASDAAGGAAPGSGNTDPDPDWMKACDVGQVNVSCPQYVPNSTQCLDFPASSELPPDKNCTGSVQQGRCSYTDAVGVCVFHLSAAGMDLTTRGVYYDAKEFGAVSGVAGNCCPSSALQGHVGELSASCKAFLTCVCGSADVQPGESVNCTEARKTIAALQGQTGAANVDQHCAEQLRLASPGCDIDGG